MKAETYKKKLLLDGKSERDIRITRSKRMIENNLYKNASYKSVTVDGVATSMSITETETLYLKKFSTMPDVAINSGSIVKWNETYWLVTDVDVENDVYYRGKLRQCNYVLKWLDDERNVITRRCCVLSNSSNDVSDDKIVSTGNDSLNVYVPYDSETVKLKRDMRMFISNNSLSPVPYIITKVNNVEHVFESHGYMIVSYDEDQLNVEEDNIELGICNYKKKGDTPTSNLVSEISGKSTTITCGYRYGTIVNAKFYKDSVEQTDVVPKWTINCSFADKMVFTYSNDNKKLTISTSDTSLIGRTFTVNLTNDDGTYSTAEKTFTIRGLS